MASCCPPAVKVKGTVLEHTADIPFEEVTSLETQPHAYLLTKFGIGVCWCCTRCIKTHTHFPQEVVCERVTVCYHKGPGVENHLLVDIKVVQIVKLVIIRSWERNSMAADKCSYVEREQLKHKCITQNGQ